MVVFDYSVIFILPVSFHKLVFLVPPALHYENSVMKAIHSLIFTIFLNIITSPPLPQAYTLKHISCKTASFHRVKVK